MKLQDWINYQLHLKSTLKPKFYKLEPSKILQQAFGCINAITFHSNYLLTGGDDTIVRLYLVDSLDQTWKPLYTAQQHVSNIFCVRMNGQNIYSCGNDGFLINYDVNRTNGTFIYRHDGACLSLSIHSSGILASAGQDGLILFDMKSKKKVSFIEKNHGLNSVQFNPTKNNLFLTCGDKGGIELFDLRRFDAPLLKYHTDLCCLGKHSNKLDITGLVWDPSGEFLVANVQLFYPTLYDYNDPFPLATLYDPSFTSLCTIKSGSFSDTMGSLLYFGGSDDATVYGWEIPSLRLLKSKREFTSDTYRNLPLYFNQNISCFPYWIDSKLKLKGHSSVVNSTCSHSSLPYIASAGVEKIVVIHSPIQIKTGIDGESDSRANPDEDVLDYFSHLIRLEKRLWDSRLWNEYL